MLAELGCRYVLVGHSERRALFGDDDALVAAKFAAVRAAGMVPVLCVGETLAEREAGRTRAVVLRQLDAVLDAAGAGEMVLAYEPVWAIGTGRSASAAQAQEVHALLRARLREQDEAAAATRIVYGGSVKAANAAGLLVQPDIDGALVGGASLDAREFLEICAQAR
jgi:triosephosphate isomerase